MYTSLLIVLCNIFSFWIPCLKHVKGFQQFCSVQFLSYTQSLRCAGCALAQAITGLSLKGSMFHPRSIHINIIPHYSFDTQQPELQ